MADEGTVRILERVAVRSGTITIRALGDVHPEFRALTVSQYRALALVASAADGLRVGEIARRMGTRPQAAGRIIQRLEAQGLLWVERGAQADRRAVVVRLTELGSRTWSEISERRQAHLAAALEGVVLPPGADEVLEAVACAIERYTS